MKGIKDIKSEDYNLLGGVKMNCKQCYDEYKSVLWFGVVLSTLVALSYGMTRFIPVDLFCNVIYPLMITVLIFICSGGAYLLFRHSDGLRIRWVYAFVLLGWTFILTTSLVLTLIYGTRETPVGFLSLNGFEMMVGDLFAWLLLVYPTEVLRPGWLNLKRAGYQLLPVLLVGAIDYFTPLDLRWLLAIYPVGLVVQLMMHIRAYRAWCEEYYASMDEVDVIWIWKYLVMCLIAGVSYCYLSVLVEPTRLFTQLWLLAVILLYSIEKALFRHDTWTMIYRNAMQKRADQATATQATPILGTLDNTYAEYKEVLEQWMQTEKPYLDKDFRLIDIRQVIPLNRTYLSQMIKAQYGCTFYQYVVRYRVEEAKQMMRDHPQMLMQDIAEACGFSSPTLFTRIFARETGMTPKEWLAKCSNT